MPILAISVFADSGIAQCTKYLVDKLRNDSYVASELLIDSEITMAPRKKSHPTDAELDVLRVLWERGPATVREVYEVLSDARDMGYTSILKIMQIMFDKGLVSRDESQRSHVYRARLKRDATQRKLVGVLADKMFDGAMDQLVLQALNTRKLKPDEIAEVRRLLDEMDT